LALLTTRSKDWDWHSGQAISTFSSELRNNFSNRFPHSRHLNSKIGIVFFNHSLKILLFHQILFKHLFTIIEYGFSFDYEYFQRI